MNFSRLFYQTFVLLAFHHFGVCDIDVQYKLNRISMIIEGIDKTWKSISIIKYRNRDVFIFNSKELNKLCGEEFSSRNIEIVALIQQTMKFTLSRITTNLRLHFNVVFPSDTHIQLFFRDIRFEQRRDCNPGININRIYKYPKNNSAVEDNILTPLSFKNVFYVKRVDPNRFEYSMSFNFVRQLTRKSQEADLIIPPKTFNISHRLNGNKYVLCANPDPVSVYVLLFPDETKAYEFSISVENYVNLDIVCSTNWLTPELLGKIDSPRMPNYPHLPYVKPNTPLNQLLSPMLDNEPNIFSQQTDANNNDRS